VERKETEINKVLQTQFLLQSGKANVSDVEAVETTPTSTSDAEDDEM
jgi:hypothetical protein